MYSYISLTFQAGTMAAASIRMRCDLAVATAAESTSGDGQTKLSDATSSEIQLLQPYWKNMSWGLEGLETFDRHLSVFPQAPSSGNVSNCTRPSAISVHLILLRRNTPQHSRAMCQLSQCTG